MSLTRCTVHGMCIFANARQDPLKPKFARAPTGAETCKFCIMLASRGFIYLTEGTAGINHYHPDCDCRIVPGFDDDAGIEGYDPDELYQEWRKNEKKAGNE